MNKSIINSVIALLIMIMVYPTMVICQEKEVRITKTKEMNGKTIVMDTVITLSEDDNERDIIKKFRWKSDNDTIDTNNNTYYYEFESDYDWKDIEDNVIYLKGGKHKGRFIIDDEDGKQRITIIGDGDEEGFYALKDLDFDIDFDFNAESLKEMEEKLKEHGEKLKGLKFDTGEDHVIVLKDHMDLEELAEIEDLRALEELHQIENLHHLNELKNIEVVVPNIHDHHNVWYYSGHSANNASENELREAGIKNKPDKLNIENMNVDIDDGVVNLSFVLADTGTPKVTIYNFYGDKIFTGKPELMNGKYVIMMDMSTKQDGTYYLQIVQKNASLTRKLRL